MKREQDRDRGDLLMGGGYAHICRVDKREFTARVYLRVSSTLMSWSDENKSCMRVDKREFA